MTVINTVSITVAVIVTVAVTIAKIINQLNLKLLRRPFRTQKIMSLPVAEATGYMTVPLQGTRGCSTLKNPI
jgi:hypothetical protein